MISAFLDDEYLYLLMQVLVSLYKSNIVNARVSTFSWSERWNVAPCCLQLPASTKRLSSQCRQLFDCRVIRALQRDTESLSLSTFWSFILTPLVGLDHFWLWRSQWLNRNVKSLYKLSIHALFLLLVMKDPDAALPQESGIKKGDVKQVSAK